MRIVFMGSAEFGIPTLDMLLNGGHRVAAVVSTPPKPCGRGRVLTDSPVTIHARSRGIDPVLLPEHLTEPRFLEALREQDADVFVVVAFRLLPPAVFTIPPLGTLNIHASLLPRYRGPAPIQRAIEAGERETGVSVFRIDEGIDTGRLIVRKSVAIGDDETTPKLYERLCRLGAEALVETLDALEKGTATPVEQDHHRASRAPKLRKEEAALDWSASAVTLYNRIRAFKPYPGTYCTIGGRRLGIEWARPVAKRGAAGATPGTVVGASAEWFDVACGKGVLRVTEVKPEGRKRMSAGAYMRGRPVREGMVLR